MDFTQTALPVTAPVGGYGMGAGGGLAGGAVGLILGALLSGNGLGLGGGNQLNTAINANQSGEIAGLAAGIANIQGELNTNQLQDGMIAISQAINTNATGIQGSISDVATAQQAANFTTLSSINGLGRDFTAQQTQGIIQALNTANLTNSIIQQGFNEVGRDAANATNQLIMGQNAMSAQLASCCCDIEKSILADGAATRALITQNRMDDLQAQLNDAKNSISNSNQTNSLAALMAQQTNTILQHIPVLLARTATV